MRHISDQCPAGFYHPANKTYCLRCEGNNISTEGSSSCTPCEAGTVANEKRTECGMFKFTHLTTHSSLINRILVQKSKISYSPKFSFVIWLSLVMIFYLWPVPNFDKIVKSPPLGHYSRRLYAYKGYKTLGMLHYPTI